MKPVSLLFGLAKDTKVLVVCAGPSLYESIEEIIQYRDHYVMIAVDTALPILDHFRIEPDLVYSVDPQALNSQYLESHTGNSILIFDPTSTYLSLRLESGPKKDSLLLLHFLWSKFWKKLRKKKSVMFLSAAPFLQMQQA